MNTVVVSQQRCLRHPEREAVARCPECRNSFCRECITEHEDRVLCSNCLAKLSRRTESRRPILKHPVQLFLMAIGLATAWAFFYLIGYSLSRAPASFHEGTLWKNLLSGS
jgi:hypothetical protein